MVSFEAYNKKIRILKLAVLLEMLFFPSYWVGPQFPNTFLFLHVTVEKGYIFYFIFWHEWVAQSFWTAHIVPSPLLLKEYIWILLVGELKWVVFFINYYYYVPCGTSSSLSGKSMALSLVSSLSSSSESLKSGSQFRAK